MRRNNEGKRYDLRPRRTNIRHWQKWRLWYDLHKTWFAHVLSACTCTVMIYSRVCHLICCPLYHLQNLKAESKSFTKDLEKVVRMVGTRQSRLAKSPKVSFAQGCCMRLNREELNGKIEWTWMGTLYEAEWWNWMVSTQVWMGEPAWGWARQLQTESCPCVFVKMWEIHGLTFFGAKASCEKAQTATVSY